MKRSDLYLGQKVKVVLPGNRIHNKTAEVTNLDPGEEMVEVTMDHSGDIIVLDLYELEAESPPGRR